MQGNFPVATLDTFLPSSNSSPLVPIGDALLLNFLNDRYSDVSLTLDRLLHSTTTENYHIDKINKA